MADLTRTTLGQIATISSGTTPSRAKGDRYFSVTGYNWVKTGDLNNGFIVDTAERITSLALEETGCRLYPPGTVLVAMYGGFNQIGRTGLLKVPAAVNQAISALVFDESQADPEYVLQYLNYRVDYWRQCAASSRKDPNITRTDVLGFPVALPPIGEQHRIAEILHTWDVYSVLLERDVRVRLLALQSLRRSLIESFTSDSGSPQYVILRDITERVRRTSSASDVPVMTISAQNGFLRQEDKFNRVIAGQSLANYVELHKGEFAYNKGNSNAYPYGCIYRLKVDKALVPHVYFCFRLTEEVEPRFLEHFFEGGGLNRQLHPLINSGVRNDGLMNISADDFFGCKVPLPSIDDQVRIANLLDAAQGEVCLLRKRIEKVQQQKRGLMQKLLTGEWRLKMD